MSITREVLLGVDQGTTNTKAIVIDTKARVLAEFSRPIVSTSEQSGVVEQDPEEMFGNILFCAAQALAAAGVAAVNVVGMGVSNQTETLIIWDPLTGRPSMPAMVWQCRRGLKEIEGLGTPASLAMIRNRTGIDIDPTFTAAKLKWIFANRPEIADALRAGKLVWGTVDSWLRFKLSGARHYETEPGNAARTMLFDIDRLIWDAELLDLFDLELDCMPTVTQSAGRLSLTSPGLFDADLPITASVGDQQASLFGHGCFSPGDMKITYGTGAFAWMNTGKGSGLHVDGGFIRTIAWQLGEVTYAREGFAMYAGAVLDWIADKFGFPSGGAGVAAAAEQAGTSAGVCLVPAFQGLASPWWRPDVRAALSGMSQSTTRGHIAHAALESIAYQARILVDGMQAASITGVDGGVTRSDYFLQMQADILGKALFRSGVRSTSAFGAALMAGIGAGVWQTTDEMKPFITRTIPVTPREGNGGSGFESWCQAVDATIAATRTHSG